MTSQLCPNVCQQTPESPYMVLYRYYRRRNLRNKQNRLQEPVRPINPFIPFLFKAHSAARYLWPLRYDNLLELLANRDFILLFVWEELQLKTVATIYDRKTRTPCSVSSCYSSEESGLLELVKFLQLCTENFTMIICEWVLMKTFVHSHVPPMKLAPGEKVPNKKAMAL